MNPIIGGALISSGAGLIGNIFGGSSVSRQINAQKNLAEYQAGLNYKYSEMGAQAAWNRDKEWYKQYSSPEALRKQYEAAGLNPALMNGGGGTQGQVAQATPANGGNGQAASIAQMEAVNQQSKMMAVQQGLAISEIIGNLSKTKMNKAEMEKWLEELGIKKAEFNETTKMNNWKISASNAELQLKTRIQEFNEILGKKHMEKTEQEIEEIGARIDEIDARIDLSDMQAKTEEQKANLIKAEAAIRATEAWIIEKTKNNEVKLVAANLRKAIQEANIAGHLAIEQQRELKRNILRWYEELSQSIYQTEQERINTKIIAIKALLTESEWTNRDYELVLKGISSITGGIINAAGAYAGARSGRNKVSKGNNSKYSLGNTSYNWE
jgi:hypothetical protein